MASEQISLLSLLSLLSLDYFEKPGDDFHRFIETCCLLNS